MKWLRDGLSSHNGLVRKGSAAALAVPKWLRSWSVDREALALLPPAFANSFPKSGTHLLAQVIEGLPGRVNYGAFLSSKTSSFQFRDRTPKSTRRFIRSFLPGEIIRGHMFSAPEYAQELAARNTVHYFIYRDPRAVVVSEALYLRQMNRWHRLSPFFRRANSNEDAIMLSINGFEPPIPGMTYPNIAERFAQFHDWLSDPNCMAIRYEDLISERQADLILEMAEFYARRSGAPCDVVACAKSMSAMIDPHRSHTFRSGKKAGWQKELTPALRERFAEIAGALLIDLGYETSNDWVKELAAAT